MDVGIGEGRQRDGSLKTIMQDLISLNLTSLDIDDRGNWRRKGCVADPHLRDLQPEGERERECLVSK